MGFRRSQLSSPEDRSLLTRLPVNLFKINVLYRNTGLAPPLIENCVEFPGMGSRQQMEVPYAAKSQCAHVRPDCAGGHRARVRRGQEGSAGPQRHLEDRQPVRLLL